MVANAFKSGIFPLQPSECTRRASMLVLSPLDFATRLERLTSKQILQRIPIALAQVKAGNISGNLPNEVFQIINSLHRAKEITKKLNSSIMNSI